MIVLHLLKLNGSVNYYKKWKLISSEVCKWSVQDPSCPVDFCPLYHSFIHSSWGEAEKSGKFEIQLKKIKLWSKFTGCTCVPCVCLRASLKDVSYNDSAFLATNPEPCNMKIT